MLFNKTRACLSLTTWVREVLPNDSLLITLIGCSSKKELPPLGSYFDFINRIWRGKKNRYMRSSLFPAGKNGKKPKKEIGSDGKLIEPEPDLYSCKELSDKILSDEDISDKAQSVLNNLLMLAGVIPSFRYGLLDPDCLTISGDGTALAVHANPYGRPVKDKDERHYSDPDAEWGWDSHEKRWYFGHSLYLFTSRNNKHAVELPLLASFTSAKRHDSINFLKAFSSYQRCANNYLPKNICLDSAHDNIPTYRLLKHFGINALIDINSRNKRYDGLPPDITMGKDAHPICRAGKKMICWGYDRNKDATKYRCPCKCGKTENSPCPFANKCSNSNYGRTVYIKSNDDLRFHTSIPRDSEQYNKIYSERTASERANNRILNNYHLQELKTRGVNHLAFWTMIICVCIHMDAWKKTGKL